MLLVRCALWCAVACGPAWAQASAEAEQLFRDGRRLMESGRFAEACVAFDGSQRLGPTLSTLMNLAACRERNQQIATAWSLFLDAARVARAEGQPDLEMTSRTRAEALEPRLSRIQVEVPEAARVDGLVITRDGVVVDPATWNRFVPIDGGHHTIAASAPKHSTWSTQITIGVEKDTRSLTVPTLPLDAAPFTTSNDPSLLDIEPRTRDAASMRPVWLAGGIAGAALVSSLGFEISARSILGDYRNAPAGPMREELYDRANLRHHLALGLAGGAIVSIAATVYLWRSARRSSTSIAIAPSIGSDGWGFVVAGAR